MRFIHTSDLHIGKIVGGFSLLEDQREILDQIVELARERKVDAVFLSGDLYDRSVAPAPAVTVLDEFLTALVELGLSVFAVAGNHDSGERLGFASRILKHQRLCLEGIPRKRAAFYDREDDYGRVRIHLLPFARPAEVKFLYGEDCSCFDEGVGRQLEHMEMLEGGRNILLTHHFVAGHREPETCDSDSRVCVGGADQVSAERFRAFDYVALGHLHSPQRVGANEVYYSGSPLKYSFSEANQDKSVIVGELREKGQLTLERYPLRPLHDMRKIRGKLAQLVRADVAALADARDYILAVLTNEEELLDPIGTLRAVYPNIMQLQFERGGAAVPEISEVPAWKERTPKQMFEAFYFQVTGKELSREQEEIVTAVIDKAKEAAG